MLLSMHGWRGRGTDRWAPSYLRSRSCLTKQRAFMGMVLSRDTETVDFNAASTFASPLTLPLPSTCSCLIRSHPTHECESGWLCSPLPLPHPCLRDKMNRCPRYLAFDHLSPLDTQFTHATIHLRMKAHKFHLISLGCHESRRRGDIITR